MKEISVIGIDLAKSVFHVYGVDSGGRCCLRKQLRRGQMKQFGANLKRCLIGMEACGGAHYWAREFQKLGHEVKLMSPQFVRPYVKSNKNDFLDAEAICEAVTRPNMRFVPHKQTEHQDIQCVHRIRQRLIRNQTALCNEIRGLLHEYGVVLPQSISQLRKQLPLIVEDAEQPLSEISRQLFSELLEEVRSLQERIKLYDQKIQGIFSQHEVCKRISKVEGIGPITATAMLGAVGDARAFKNGRQFAAWLGLVPRQVSTGGKTTLRGISKRGDRYLRTLLIHGTRSVLRRVEHKTDPRSRWIQKKLETRGFNKTCVALANKNARILWSLLVTGEKYKQAA